MNLINENKEQSTARIEFAKGMHDVRMAHSSGDERAPLKRGEVRLRVIIFMIGGDDIMNNQQTNSFGSTSAKQINASTCS